ncbi:MAG: hypothetical protein ACKVP0_11060 [Pirellulaceae bacterium]
MSNYRTSRGRAGDCDICCRLQADLQERFIRVQRTDTVVGGRITRFFYARCYCCSGCFRKRMRAQMTRQVGPLLSVFAAICLGIAATLFVVIRWNAEVKAMGELGSSVLMIGMFLGLPIGGGLFMLWWWNELVRADLAKIFSPQVRSRLFAMLNLKEWNIWANPHFLATLPSDETAVDLSDLK